MKFTKEAQDVIDDLLKQIDNLQDRVYSAARTARQVIIQDLIRMGHDADSAIASATELCAFIEGVPPISENRNKKKHRVKASSKPGALTGKRKYTKRSKFWNKKS